MINIIKKFFYLSLIKKTSHMTVKLKKPRKAGHFIPFIYYNYILNSLI